MRNGVALLVTLFLVMLMSIVIGASLRTQEDAKETVEKERLLIQSGAIVEDVLRMLQNSPKLQAIVDDNTSLSLYSFLSSVSMIPFESEGYRVLVSLQSARGKLNINTFSKATTKREKQRRKRLLNFLNGYGFDDDLYYYILDAEGGIKEDGSYKSDLFFTEPELFRDYIASSKQMDQVLRIYAKKTGIDVFSKLDFDTIFLYGIKEDVKLDLNYATPKVWELVAGVSKEKAIELSQNGGAYERVEDLGLSEDEKNILSLFDYSFFEPVILVDIEIVKEKISQRIRFEYDIKKKKAGHFVYEIPN